MSSVSADHQADAVEPNRPARELDSAREYFELVFDRAPVMMHAIDKDGRLVKVNRLWLQKLGYTREEVLGRRSTDFLTEESRARAVNDTLPLFWRVGSARSVGYQFVRKDGRVIDVLLDADVSRDERGQLVTLAVLRDNHDLVQWRQASAILTAIRELGRIRSDYEAVSFSEASARRDIAIPMVWQPPGDGLESHLLSNSHSRRLTKRELEVLGSLASGASNKDIADQLGLGVRTVRFHVANLFGKLEISNRTQAARVAFELGYFNN